MDFESIVYTNFTTEAGAAEARFCHSPRRQRADAQHALPLNSQLACHT